MRTVFALFFFAALFALPGAAEAKRTTTSQGGKEVVEHTSRGPVVVHRMLPPYGLGKHVYSGRKP